MLMFILMTLFYFQRYKLNVPVVTLSVTDNQKLSKRLSKGFEISVYWHDYKTKIDSKNTINEGRYFLDISSNFVGPNNCPF